MEIFDGVVQVFNFIVSLLQTIIDGVYGIVSIFSNVIQLMFSIIGILPQELYLITYSFISVFSIAIVYKLFRKG